VYVCAAAANPVSSNPFAIISSDAAGGGGQGEGGAGEFKGGAAGDDLIDLSR